MSQPEDSLRPIDRSLHTLLVVDDSPASRYATQRRLSSAGFKVIEAATGREALTLADESLSVIVLDVHLPDIDGFELSRLLRSQPKTARIPILHISAAFVTDDDKVRGLDSGADAYLTHPIEPAVLVATVQALVRTRVAESAMRASEAKFRSIYANAPTGICLLDGEGRFIDANPAMLQLLDQTADSVLGHAVAEFVAPDDLERARSLTRYAYGKDSIETFALQNSSGRSVPLEWRMSALLDGVTLAQVTDVSARLEQERLREQSLDRERDARASAEHLNRMKDEFIAVLSHELRSPLNAIIGWVHVLLRRGGNEETMRGLAAIERNGMAQAQLISDLLDMSRLNVGKLALARARVDPVEVVRAAIAALGSGVAGGEREIRVVPKAGLPLVYGDAARLQQVIWNLLSNAIKFSPDGTPVDVTISEDSRGVRIAISDYGQGIAAEFLPHVFERFSQADSSSQRHRGGLGLGLSIAQQLVQAHGGELSARSDGVGLGATFEIWLPGSEEASLDSGFGAVTPAGPGTSADRALDGLNVLVVDDDPDALSMLRVILSDRGAAVTGVSSYEEALAALEHSKPDVLLSDIGLPGKDGHQLIQEIRRRESGAERLPAIALTAFVQQHDRTQAIAAGFDVHCTKPIRPLQLVRAIWDLARGDAGTP